MYRLLFVLVTAQLLVDAAKLPSYVIPCKKNDPNISECAKKHAVEAIPYILKGSKELKNPNLLPLRLPLIEIKPSDSLSISLKDVVLGGLEGNDLRDIKIDLEKQHIDVVIAFSRLNLQCQYSMNGRILILPIKGSGPANLTFDDVVVTYSIDYDLIKKDGKTYIDPNLKPKASYVLSKSYYYFENLFDGDKVLGERMNAFLNENSDDINKDLGESISQTISAVVTNIVRLIVSAVPYDSIFV